MTGTVIVTGGSSGLGAAVVAAASAEGRRCVVLDRQPPADGVPWVKVDLADAHAIAAAVEDDGLDDWLRVVQVNLIGTAAVVRVALPHLRVTHGRVVTVASTLGLRALSDATAYCASKFGVVGFTRALAAETAGEVGVTLLIPGGMSTAFFDDRPEQYKPGPDAKLNDPAHVASVVMFALAQPAGSEIRELVVAGSTETSWP